MEVLNRKQKLRILLLNIQATPHKSEEMKDIYKNVSINCFDLK